MMQKVKLPFPVASLALVLLMASHVWSESPPGAGFQKFFKERVRFGGFVENVTGLGISHGHSHTTNSPVFNMNRFTLQPEINIDFGPKVKSFISWRFAFEPRYSAETKSRRKTVAPAGSGGSLRGNFYDEYKGVPWEAVLDVNPVDKLQVRFGRQFISWGETDGLRLLDVINPQDGTIGPPGNPNLFNLDETRVPQWGMRMWYTVRPVSNSIFEFFYNPGFEEKKKRTDEFMPANDIGDGKADGDYRYGRWSVHPETRMPVGNMFANPIPGNSPVVIPIARREFPNAGDAWKIGGRITHNFGALNVGLGYIYGYNPQEPDMVFKVEGPRRSLGPPGPGTRTGIPIKLINDRTSIFAAHFNYPLGTYGGIPIKTALRGEIAFYPNKPYNISDFPGPSLTPAPGATFRAGPDPNHTDGLIEKNTLRYALGFDRTTFIPFLHPDDPWRAFRMSFQIFQSIILGHKTGIRQFGHASKIDQVTTSLTFRINTGYLGDTILPDFFVGYDPRGYWNLNPAVSYAPPWNERIKVSLVGVFYGGRDKFAGLGGLFKEKDSVFLKLRYQW